MWPNPDDPVEPYWSDDDRFRVLAFQAWDAQRCARCGTRPDDWSPDERIRPNRYEFFTYHCPGCMNAELQRAEIATDDHVAEVRVRPFDPIDQIVTALQMAERDEAAARGERP